MTDNNALALEALNQIEQYSGAFVMSKRPQLAIIRAALSSAAPAAGEVVTAAARDVLAERQRQISAEGWTPERDDEYTDGAMASAAASYALAANGRTGGSPPLPPTFWPWDARWWKPTDERRSLVKAGALILAEIERLDRAAVQPEAETSAEKAAPADEHEAFQHWANDQWDGRPAPHNAWLGFRAGVIYGRTQADAPVAEPVAPSRIDAIAAFEVWVLSQENERTASRWAAWQAGMAFAGTRPPAPEEGKDAARYRYLRQQHEESDSGCSLCVFSPINDSTLEPVGSMPGELDAAIDAAMAQGERG